MAKRRDLTGKKVGQLTVIEPAANRGRDTTWLCQCECGRTEDFRTAVLNRGAVSHCSDLRAHPRSKSQQRAVDLAGKIKTPIQITIKKWKGNADLLKQVGQRLAEALTKKFGENKEYWYAYALKSKEVNKKGMRLIYNAIGEDGNYRGFYEGDEAILIEG